MANKSEKKAVVEKKDPAIAALISIVCIIVGAPAVGYFYIDNAKKGIEYLIASWIVWAVFAVGYFGIGLITYGLGCVCLPVFVVPLAFDLLIVWDVYLAAKGEPTKLPTF